MNEQLKCRVSDIKNDITNKVEKRITEQYSVINTIVEKQINECNANTECKVSYAMNKIENSNLLSLIHICSVAGRKGPRVSLKSHYWSIDVLKNL